ncbi:hypothetical protein FHG87_003701 [Trinorchestia longiramus]|nr:hypothetical protein FHG87_003701 [Trinorchestia longiramus]
MAQVKGVMFVSGYVMSIKNDGRAGIVSVRGGGGKFVLIKLAHFYVNQKLVKRPHTLHTFIEKGSPVNLFIKDHGIEKMIITFRVRYESVMCWIGSHGQVPDVGPYRDFWQRRALECSEIPPSNNRYDVHIDVPVSSLTEHSGIIYWCSETYGLISMKESKLITNVIFTADRFFLNQRKFPTTENLAYATADAFVVTITKPISRRKIFGVYVDMEAVVVFLGDKPLINFIYEDPKIVKPNDKHQQLDDNGNYSKAKDNCWKNGTKSWADEANDALKESKVSSQQVQKKMKENSSKDSQTAMYFTGCFLGLIGGHFAYGSERKACRFSMECFHVADLKLSTVEAVLEYLSSLPKKPILHSYVTALKKPIDLGHNVRILWEAVCVWHGPAPASLKVKINSLKKMSLQHFASATNCSQETDVLVDRRDLMTTLPQVPFHDSIKRGRLTGFVLSCSGSDAIVTGFSNTVYLTRERFYVNGQKYRGTSLLSFFQKKNEKVNTYIVPMKMRVVRGCAVYSRAVCAWVGDEPADLQKMILTDKIYTNFEISDTHEKSKGQFYYMVGHVQKMGETCGIIECQVDGSTVNVGFSIHEMYKYGKKVSSRSILSMHSQVLLTSRWSVLAYCTPHKYVPGANYTAVAVWHHGDQILLFDEFQIKLPFWHRQLLTGSCSCADTVAMLADKTYFSISRGAITETRKDEVAVGIKDQGIVVVRRDHFVVDGCSCCLSEVDEHRMCYVVFDSNKSPLYAWMGRQPGSGRTRSDGVDISHVDCTSDDSDAETDGDGDDGDDCDSDGNDEEEVDSEDTHGDLSSIELSDPSEFFSLAKKGLSVHKVGKTSRRKNAIVSHSELDSFSGFHASGHIVNMESDFAILSWYSEKMFQGTIFVYLDVNHLYVNGEPFKKTCYTQFEGEKVLMNHTCHIYLNTVSETQSYRFLEISAVASAGWIGKKPIFMPPPGKQGKGVFDIHALRIAYSKPPHHNIEFCSHNSWLEHLEKDSLSGTCDCKHQFFPAFICAKTALNSSDEKQNSVFSSPQPNIGYTSRSPVPDLSTLALTDYDFSSATDAQNHLNGSWHAAQEHYTSTDTTSDDLFFAQPVNNLKVSQATSMNLQEFPGYTSIGSTRLDDFTLDEPAATLGDGQTPPATSTSDFSSMKGQVVELHPFLGKLQGSDGTTHYFKSEQFFLFGISLKNVELYNVLIQGLEVQYRTGASGQLEACWYGSLLRDTTSYTRINQWCSNNFVPDELRDFLVSVARPTDGPLS